MLAATKAIAVAREPAIQLVGEPSHQRKLEDPTEHPSPRKDSKQLLDRIGTLRGPPTRPDELHRVRVGLRRNPWETCADARILRGQKLDLVTTVPPRNGAHRFLTHPAVSIVDERPRAPFASTVADASAECKADDPMSIWPLGHAEISVRIVGGFESVL